MLSLTDALRDATAISVTMTAEDLQDFAKQIVKETMSGMVKATEEEPVWLTPDQVARRLGVTRCTLWRWDKEGYLTNCKFGNRTRYKLSDVLRIENAELSEKGV